jgi:TRAP-type uncharacterized transport system substrate-binding protein
MNKQVFFGYGFALMVLAGLGAYFTHQFVREEEEDAHLHLRLGFTTGGAVRRAFLESIAQADAGAQLKVELVETSGMEDTLDRLEQGALDAGVIMSGVEEEPSDVVQELMPLYVEPLHLMVKAELYSEVSLGIAALKGKSVSMDGRHTGTHVLSWELMRFAGLVDASEKPKFLPSYLSQNALHQAVEAGRGPDAAFISEGVPSGVVRELVVRHGYLPVELPYGESFGLDDFLHAKGADRVDGTKMRLNRLFVGSARIPAFVYSVDPPVPAKDISTIGSRLVLVGRRDLDSAAAARLIELVLSPNVAQRIRPPLTPALFDLPYEFGRHEGAEEFLRSRTSLSVDDVTDFYEDVMKKWGIAFAIFLFVQKLAQRIWTWFRRKEADEAQKPEIVFAETRTEAVAIEHEVVEALDREMRLPRERAVSWELRLHQLRLRALKTAEGMDQSNEALPGQLKGILALVRDVSEAVRRYKEDQPPAGTRQSA